MYIYIYIYRVKLRIKSQCQQFELCDDDRVEDNQPQQEALEVMETERLITPSVSPALEYPPQPATGEWPLRQYTL